MKTVSSHLEKQDEVRFCNFPDLTFQELLAHVSSHIAHQETVVRETITTGERFVIALRHLATRKSFRSLQYLFRVIIPIFII